MSSPGAEKWMVATSHPEAVRASLEMLEQGGNAVDAAVVAAAVLTVVDPCSTGIGGDVFAMYWGPQSKGPVGFAAAGPAPSGLSVTAVTEAGFATMPPEGPWSITVPGAVAGWQQLLDRFGTVDLARAIAPAIAIAEEGFEVTPTIARNWSNSADKLRRYPYSASVYLPDGRPPEAGNHMVNADLAASLRAVARDGPKVFYEGWIAERIEEAVRELGGVLRAADLASWSGPRWTSPIASRYRDVHVFELPPPNQGLLALQALKLYERIEMNSTVDEEHAAIECLKLALADAISHIADPDFHPVPITELLSDAYLSSRTRLVNMATAGIAEAGRVGDTVYVAAMKEQEGCSFIQSLYDGFGSGVGVEGTGIVLQNRGAGFTLQEGHPNRPEPRKRPFHTIIPAMLGRDGAILGCLGVVGGFMQAQGHLQVIRNLLDRGLDPQAAVSAARFRILGDRQVGFERDFDAAVIQALGERGHEATELNSSDAGGGQLIIRRGSDLVGGSDPRKDGLADGV